VINNIVDELWTNKWIYFIMLHGLISFLWSQSSSSRPDSGEQIDLYAGDVLYTIYIYYKGLRTMFDEVINNYRTTELRWGWWRQGRVLRRPEYMWLYKLQYYYQHRARGRKTSFREVLIKTRSSSNWRLWS